MSAPTAKFCAADLAQLTARPVEPPRPRRPGRPGVRNPNAKVSAAVVRLIRELRADGWPYDALMDVCGLSKSGVARICRGETWRG
jgi:AraC-like DNA-binding protein